MFFFIKKKKLILDCYTYNKGAFDVLKIEHAKKFYPDWWRKIPAVTPLENHNSDLIGTTMKGCSGLIDYYRTGFMIPLWTEMIAEIGGIGSSYLRIAMVDPLSDAKQHHADQRGSFLPEDQFSHIKLISPWHIEANMPVPFVLLKPIWNYDNPSEFIVPPGILDFYNQHGSHINIFFERKKETTKINLQPGIPIAHFIPQTEMELEIRHHLIGRQEYDDRSRPSHRIWYINSYNKYVKLKEKISSRD